MAVLLGRRLRKIRTVLRIVSSGRSFQIACTAAFGSTRFSGFVYYFITISFCHNNVPTKVIVAAPVSLIK